ncbi:YadA-like family protein [Moraxella nasibovis]|uniref:YadA-like family protein n=1 Tax=Moraxella nasibovis TaxID=2904120 RepID=UPI0024105126|nr:YadA-like family protein [Moraxella nasibovis]WFF39152.1 YadA-like family protein [Moraxella nasibovis]
MVSVGDVGKERRIQNVAAGLISATSTDAINGSQLYAVADKLAAVDAAANRTNYFHVNTDALDQPAGNPDTNEGTVDAKGGAVGQYAVAAGIDAQAKGSAAIAIGLNAGKDSEGTLTRNTIMIGNHAGNLSSLEQGVLLGIGVGTNRTGANVIAIGEHAGSYRPPQLDVFNPPEPDDQVHWQDLGYTTNEVLSNSTVIGRFAGLNATGFSNDYLGWNAGELRHGDANIAMGHLAGAAAGGYLDHTGSRVGVIGSYNVALGAASGQGINGYNNIAIGINSNHSINFSEDNKTPTKLNPDVKVPYVNDAIAIGQDTTAQKDTAIAIGKNAKAAVAEGDVALGADSETTQVTPTANAAVNGITYGNFAGAAPTSAVSIGAAGSERQLQNVAAGRISATSTDAINGSQLYIVADELSKRIGTEPETYFHVNTGANRGTGNAVTNLGKISEAAGATAPGAITGGINAQATEGGAIAIGQDSRAVANHAIAIGVEAGKESTEPTGTIMIGEQAGYRTSAQSSVLLGRMSGHSRTASGIVAIGTDAASYDLTEEQNQMGMSYLAYTTAIGMSAATNATGHYNDYVGGQAGYTRHGDYNVAMGYLAGAGKASSNEVDLTGMRAGSMGDNNVSLGTYSALALNGNDNITIGQKANQGWAFTEDNMTATEEKPDIKVAYVNDTIAIGQDTKAQKDTAIAIGKNAKAAAAVGDVALGAGSETLAVTPTSNATVNGITYGNFAGSAPKSAVSVGAKDSERQIQHVAAGRITADSTDAINGSQLYMVTQGTLDQMPVVYTKADGTKVFKQPDGKFLDADGNEVDAGDVIASMNNPQNSTTAPMTLTNIKSNLAPVTTATTEQPNANHPVLLEENANNAATLGDVLNAGWNLQENGDARDVVVHADTVNFVNGAGTTAVVETDGKTSTIKYDVNVDGETITTKTDPNDPTKTVITVNTTPLADADNDGKVDEPAAPNALVTAQTVANAINNSGWKLDVSQSEGQAVGTGEELINPSDKVTIDAGKNISITQAGSTISIATADDVEFASVKTNSLEVPTDNGSSVKIDNNGVDVGGNVISNVADGVEDGDAVNVSQLNAAKANVVGEEGIEVTSESTPEGTTYTVSAKTDGVTTYVDNNGNIAAITGDLNTSTDGSVSSEMPNSLVTGDQVANAINNSGFNVTSGATGSGEVDGKTTELINPSETVTFQAGDNLVLNQAENVFTYSLNDDININSVQFNDGPKITSDGDNIKVEGPNGEATKITNVADGTGDNDAVNVSQLKDAQAAATTKVEEADGINVEATENEDGSTTYTVSAKTDGVTTYVDNNGNIAAITGDLNTSTDGSVSSEMPNSLVTGDQVANAINNSGFNVTSGATGSGEVNGTTTELINPSETVTFQAGDNLVLNQAENVFTYSLNDDININSVQFNDGPKITSDGDNIKVEGPNGEATKITNVADGTDDNDAVNVSQLKDAQAAATTKVEEADGINVEATENADGSTTYTVSAKTDGTTTKIDDNGNIAAVTTTFTPSTDGKVGAPADNGDSLVTANTVADAINNSGWNLAADGTEGTELINPSDTVTFKTGSDNLTVKREGADIIYDLADDINVSSVQFNDGPKITSDGDNIKVEGPNGEATKITNVADGTGDNDAVNVSQLKDAQAAATTKVEEADGINVEATENADGSTTYTVSAKTDGVTTYVDNNGNIAAITGDLNTSTDGSVSSEMPNSLVTGDQVANAINNSGWNLLNNGAQRDVVRPADAVNFINGKGTTAVVETAADGKSSTVKFDINVDGETITVDEDGNLTVNKDAVDTNTVTTVTAGKNMVVTNTGTDDAPNYEVKTADDVNFNSVTVGPVVINQNGINAGDKKITNVAAGDISATSKDAVNGSQLYALADQFNTKIETAKTVVDSADKSVTVTPSTTDTGATKYDLSVKTDGDTIKKNPDGSLAVNTTPLTNNANGAVNTPAAPNAIATAGDVANAINNSGFTLTAQGANGSVVNPGETVDMNNTDGNIVITKPADSNNVTYNLAKDVKVDSVTAGGTEVNNDGITIAAPTENNPDNVVSLTQTGLNNGGNRITNVAPGVDATDAVNVSQLQGTANYLNNRIDGVADDANAGVSSAMAMAALPQAYIPGKSMLTGGIASYNGEGAVAVGFSKLSDNGRWVLKVSGSADTQGNAGGAVGAGFHF